jgi:hypothetical protein
MMRGRRIASQQLWLLTACLALVPISPVRAVTGPAAVAQLNLQRDANGLPGDLVERPDWTAACAQHNEYMRLNNVVEHSETPGNPGYSTEGAWAAGSANLGGGGWAADRNPWDNAPIHLMQLLSPKLAQLGASDASGHVCATTWPGYTRTVPKEPTIFSYPGNGTTKVPATQVAAERPFVPGDFVGLPMGTQTGPHLYVMTDAPERRARVVSASLVGPAGAVEVRVVDNFTPSIGDYLPAGGIIVPVSPLQRASVYQASTTLDAGGRTLTRTWTFKTSSQPSRAIRNGGHRAVPELARGVASPAHDLPVLAQRARVGAAGADTSPG